MTKEEWQEILEPTEKLTEWLREPGRSRLRIHISQGQIQVYDIYDEMTIEAAREMSKELRREILSSKEEVNLGFSRKTLLQYIATAERAFIKAHEKEGEEYI